MEAIVSSEVTPFHELPLERQIEVIRREIAEKGESVVSCEELRVLCEDVVAPWKQFTAIALIASYEGWSFTFFPDKLHVRFAMLGERP